MESICNFNIIVINVSLPYCVLSCHKCSTLHVCYNSSEIVLVVKAVIEEFTLIVASWVIRARWLEIQRFVLEFKAK